MIEIIPAIVPRNFKELANKLAQIEGLANWVQIDIADGLFTPDHTWEAADDLNQITGRVKIEIHLMVEQPEQYLSDWRRVADRIIVHPEATEKLSDIFADFDHSPVKLGVALLLETPLTVLEPYRERLELVQLMSIAKIGHQGEPFAEATLERVRLLRTAYPDVTISVDGGVNEQNAPALLAAGADHLVIGSAIWQSGDVAGAIKKFHNLI